MSGLPYAEVIGDPIGQSKSPLIHGHWLAALGLAGVYRAVRVPPDGLADYLAARRADPLWRGCNVTIPHKRAAMAHLDHVDPAAARIGAVNCIHPGPTGLHGANTDIDGVAAALGPAEIEGRKAVLIGAGGAARAAIDHLHARRASGAALIVRDPFKAAALRDDAGTWIEIWPLERCAGAFEGAAVIINASPMGMAGAPPMPPELLALAAAHAPGQTLFDMVYAPLETPFLATARGHGGRAVDGLAMLIGQARPAFQLFFGRPAPPDEARLRALLAG